MIIVVIFRLVVPALVHTSTHTIVPMVGMLIAVSLLIDDCDLLIAVNNNIGAPSDSERHVSHHFTAIA
jgi:hypothetical protein